MARITNIRFCMFALAGLTSAAAGPVGKYTGNFGEYIISSSGSMATVNVAFNDASADFSFIDPQSGSTFTQCLKEPYAVDGTKIVMESLAAKQRSCLKDALSNGWDQKMKDITFTCIEDCSTIQIWMRFDQFNDAEGSITKTASSTLAGLTSAVPRPRGKYNGNFGEYIISGSGSIATVDVTFNAATADFRFVDPQSGAIFTHCLKEPYVVDGTKIVMESLAAKQGSCLKGALSNGWDQKMEDITLTCNQDCSTVQIWMRFDQFNDSEGSITKTASFVPIIVV